MTIIKSNCMMVATSVLLFVFVLLSPPFVMAQVSPWSCSSIYVREEG